MSTGTLGRRGAARKLTCIISGEGDEGRLGGVLMCCLRVQGETKRHDRLMTLFTKQKAYFKLARKIQGQMYAIIYSANVQLRHLPEAFK